MTQPQKLNKKRPRKEKNKIDSSVILEQTSSLNDFINALEKLSSGSFDLQIVLDRHVQLESRFLMVSKPELRRLKLLGLLALQFQFSPTDVVPLQSFRRLLDEKISDEATKKALGRTIAEWHQDIAAGLCEQARIDPSESDYKLLLEQAQIFVEKEPFVLTKDQGWIFNAKRFKELSFVQPDGVTPASEEDIQAWLGLTRESAYYLALGKLGSWQALLELGFAESVLEQIEPLSAIPDFEMVEQLVRLEALIQTQQYSQAAESLANENPATGLRAALFLQQARLAWVNQDLENANSLVNKTLAGLKDNPRVLAHALMLKAMLEFENSQTLDPAKAAAQLQQALVIFQESRWWWGLACCMTNLGIVYHEWAKYIQTPKASERFIIAQTWLLQSLKLFQTLKINPPDAQLQIRLAQIASQLNQPQEVQTMLKTLKPSLGLNDELQLRFERFQMYLRLGQLDRARQEQQELRAFKDQLQALEIQMNIKLEGKS